jgi:hypothetical protein
MADTLTSLSMTSERFAGPADIKGKAVKHFLAGKALSHHNRPKIEAALSELADYASQLSAKGAARSPPF